MECPLMKRKLPALLLLTSSLASPLLSAQAVGGEWEEIMSFSGGGHGVADAGDVDGDGISDVITTNGGEATVYSGATAAVLHRFSPPYDRYWQRVASAGDIDGDGYGDILIGDDATHLGGNISGVTVYSGATGGVLLFFDDQTYGIDQMGFSMASVGDVDGDSVPDILVGGHINQIGSILNPGVVFLFSGASGSLLHRFAGTSDYESFGSAVAGAGDINGDGVPDLIIGAYSADSLSIVDCGAVFVYSGADYSLIHQIYGTEANRSIGSQVANAGDVDLDGVPDFLVGGYHSTWPGPFTMDGFLFSGASATLIHHVWPNTDSSMGGSLAAGKDVDGDGIPDFMLGIPGKGHMPHGGSVFVFSGNSGDAIKKFNSSAHNAEFGMSGAFLEDKNGDGLADIIIGADRNHEAFVYSLNPYLHPEADTLSVASGSTLQFDLAFPISEAGVPYTMLGSLAGIGPTWRNGLEIPLTPDPLFSDFMSGNIPTALQGAVGSLDANAEAQVILTAGPSLSRAIGRTVYFAAVTYDLGPPAGRMSSAVRYVEILP